MSNNLKITVDDEVFEAYEDMANNSYYRYIIYKLSDDRSKLFIEKKVQSKALSRMEPKVAWEIFLGDIKAADSYRFCLYDYQYRDEDGLINSKLIFLNWKPENASIEQMKGFNSGRDAIKPSFTDVEYEFTGKNMADIAYQKILSKIKS